jgi:hypothetical protein
LLRALLPLCYGFVTGQTSISLPFYRLVTGVTAPEGGKGYAYPTNAYRPIFLVSTENCEEPLTGKTTGNDNEA